MAEVYSQEAQFGMIRLAWGWKRDLNKTEVSGDHLFVGVLAQKCCPATQIVLEVEGKGAEGREEWEEAERPSEGVRE